MWFTKIFSKTSLSLSLSFLALSYKFTRKPLPLSHSPVSLQQPHSYAQPQILTRPSLHYLYPSLSLSLSLYLSNTLSRAHKATYCILSELKLKRENNFQSFSPISIFFAFSSNVRRPLRSCQFLSNKHFLNVSSSHSRSST